MGRGHAATPGHAGAWGVMPRFFFHLRDGDDLTMDSEGTDLPDVEAARAAAIPAARDMLAEGIRRDGRLGRQNFEISDETGTVLATVPFRSAIEGL